MEELFVKSKLRDSLILDKWKINYMGILDDLLIPAEEISFFIEAKYLFK